MASPKIAGGSPGLTQPSLMRRSLQTLVGSRLNGGRTQEDGPGYPAASTVPAQVRHISVDPRGQGVGPVNVPLDHRRPVVGKVTIELRLGLGRSSNRMLAGIIKGLRSPLSQRL